MGYSNNKWRKLLTILMIINLCLILFSKITRVFGATPTTFFNETVAQIDPIQITNNYNLTPINFLFSSNYDMYTIIVKSLPNEDHFAGYGIIVHKGDTLKIQYSDKKNGVNRAYPTLVFSAPNKICLLSFNVSLTNNLQTNYDNRINQFSTSDFWWSTAEETTFAGYTFSQFANAFPNNILYSSNSYIDFYNTSNEKIDEYTPYIPPSFDNITEIENGNPDGVLISPGDYSMNDNLYFHLLEINTGLSNSDSSIYYYSDKTFLLNKDSNYYSTWLDPNIDGFYYYIPRYKLGLSQNTSYLYVLNNSKEQIQNSYGIYSKDVSKGIYDVIQSDTAGVITATEEQTDRMKSIEQSLIENQEATNSINNTLTDTNITTETESDVNTNLNFNNQNQTLNNLNNGFFSRLTNMLSDLLGYDLAEDTSVNLPLPNSNKSIVLHSIDINNNITGALRLIINAFWIYIFTFYLWKFINKIYIAVSTGHILDSFSSSGEAITNDML